MTPPTRTRSRRRTRCCRYSRRSYPLPVPEPVAAGEPGCGYPHPWSARRWLPGTTVRHAPDLDRQAFARDLGSVLTVLRGLPTTGAPLAGQYSFYRGCHPSVYGEQVDTALKTLAGRVDVGRCREVWLAAITSAWPAAPVWFHGDVDVGNLLVRDGRLSAVIDFGCCGVGDPACDLALAWTFFSTSERQAFRESVGLDDDTWRRARGWVLWKALVTMAGLSSPDPQQTQERNLAAALTDSPP